MTCTLAGQGDLFCERLFNKADNGHQDSASDTTAGDTADNTTDIHSAATCGQAKHAKQLAADAATQYAGNGVAESSQ